MLRLVLEKTLNSLIANDSIKLGSLEGSTIALHVLELDLSLYFVCINARIYALEAQQQNPDVDIRVSKSVFLSLFQGKSLKHLLDDEAVEIVGNVKTAQALSDLFSEASIDIEELIAQHTGDIIAHQLGRALRFTKKRPNSASFGAFETLKDDLSALLVAPSRSRFFDSGAK